MADEGAVKRASLAEEVVRDRVAPVAAALGQDEDFCVQAVLAGDLKVVRMPDPFTPGEKVDVLIVAKDIWP